jgi:hypothetical protein
MPGAQQPPPLQALPPQQGCPAAPHVAEPPPLPPVPVPALPPLPVLTVLPPDPVVEEVLLLLQPAAASPIARTRNAGTA